MKQKLKNKTIFARPNQTKKINKILKEVLKDITPGKEELINLENSTKKFIEKFNESKKKFNAPAEIVIGGSYAKGTIIKKDQYDIDTFAVFKEDKEISERLNNILLLFSKPEKIHGSRNYFSIKVDSNIFIEVIPVIKINKAQDAKNITDLSISHVKYVRKKAKNKNILNDIRIAKSFCNANGFYGAESYIKGFSGYSLELLIIHYGNFINFIKNMAYTKEKKIVIDSEKMFKNKKEILINLNQSKLNSPLILIDPTYKNRNASASLSDETFLKFKKKCIKFLKNPSIKFFSKEEFDYIKEKDLAKKKNLNFVLLESKTNLQSGDIAGSKLLKFYAHLNEEMKKIFEIKKTEFNYGGKKFALFYFVIGKNKERISIGPKIEDKINLLKFRKKHKKSFIKNDRIYSMERSEPDGRKFLTEWIKSNRVKIKEMQIESIKIVK